MLEQKRSILFQIMHTSIRQDQVCQKVTVVWNEFNENLPTFRQNVVPQFSNSSTLKTEPVHFSEALIIFNVGAPCCIPADSNLHITYMRGHRSCIIYTLACSFESIGINSNSYTFFLIQAIILVAISSWVEKDLTLHSQKPTCLGKMQISTSQEIGLLL